MASLVYNKFKEEVMEGVMDLTSGGSGITVKCALVTSSYTPNADHDYWDDVSANEVANGNGYTTDGATLTTKAVTVDNTDDEGVFDADDVSWAASTITARYAVLYKYTGNAATSTLIALIDFGSNQSSSAGTFTITFAAEGILNVN